MFVNPRLIPRYHWDYGWRPLLQGLAAVAGVLRPPETFMQPFRGREVVYTTSGRASIVAILRALQLPPKSGIGVPLFCCPVVFDAVLHAGFRPVFLDVLPNDCTLSAADLAHKADRLAAVIVVHMFGNAADLDALAAITTSLPVVEDCAQSLFTEYKGTPTGHLSLASFFSFRTGKYLSAPEGSAILCRDLALLERVRQIVKGFPQWSAPGDVEHVLAAFAKATLYHPPFYGTVGLPLGKVLDRRFNVTAKSGVSVKGIARSDKAMILERMQSMREKVERQRRNAVYFLENIRMNGVALPSEMPYSRNNYYQFAVQCSTRKHRDELADYFLRNGIDCARYLSDIAETAANNYGYAADCPVAEGCADRVLVLPNHYNLTRRQLDHIVRTANEADRWL